MTPKALVLGKCYILSYFGPYKRLKIQNKTPTLGEPLHVGIFPWGICAVIEMSKCLIHIFKMG